MLKMLLSLGREAHWSSGFLSCASEVWDTRWHHSPQRSALKASTPAWTVPNISCACLASSLFATAGPSVLIFS